jgi:hypothetical protein
MTQEEATLLNSTNIINSMDFMLEMSAKGIHMMDLGFKNANYNIIEDQMVMEDSAKLGRTYMYATEPSIYVNLQNQKIVCTTHLCVI